MTQVLKPTPRPRPGESSAHPACERHPGAHEKQGRWTGVLKGRGACWSWGAGTLWRQQQGAAPVPCRGEQAFLRAGIVVNRGPLGRAEDCDRGLPKLLLLLFVLGAVNDVRSLPKRGR